MAHGGSVFQNIWNALCGKAPGTGIKDVDLFYCDTRDLSWDAEDDVIRRAASLLGDLARPVEVRNQARVHLWYAQRFGTAVTPMARAAEGIERFAAPCCAVGIRRSGEGLEVYAPYGLGDLFAGVVRPAPGFAHRGVYEAKAAQYEERWPFLTVLPWDAGRDGVHDPHAR